MSSVHDDVIVKDVEYKRCAKKIRGAVNEISLIKDEFVNIMDNLADSGILDKNINAVLASLKYVVGGSVSELEDEVKDIEPDTKSFIKEIDQKDKYFY